MTKLSDKRKAALDSMMKQTIYEAAVKTLLERGLEGLTMDHVAEAAGMAKGTVYNYFRNKQGLIIYIYTKMAEPFIAHARTISLSRLPPREKLEKIIEQLFQDFEHNRHIIIILAQGRIRNLRNYHEQLGRMPEFAHSVVARWTLENIIASIIQEGMEARQFRSFDCKLVTIMFLGALTSMIDKQIDENRFLPAAENAQQLCGVFTAGLLRPSGAAK